MYGPPSGYAAPPPPPWPPERRRSSARQSALWLSGAALTVIAAAVIIAVTLGGGGGSPVADRSTTPPAGPASSTSSPTGDTSTSLGATPIGAPTTDVLPSNSGSDSCGTDVQPGLVAVSVATVLGLSTKGAKPTTFVASVLRDCTSASVRSRIDLLFGIAFGSDYSGDLTGGNDSGPTAMYRVSNTAGTGVLVLTLTRQQDKHYEVTAFSYSG